MDVVVAKKVAWPQDSILSGPTKQIIMSDQLTLVQFDFTGNIIDEQNEQGQKVFWSPSAISDMSSAVEFTNVWLHKDIPAKRHPTAREVNSEFTGLVKVIKLRREEDICMGKS